MHGFAQICSAGCLKPILSNEIFFFYLLYPIAKSSSGAPGSNRAQRAARVKLQH